MNCIKKVLIAAMLLSFNSFSQIEIPKNLDVRQKEVTAFGNSGSGKQISIGGKEKSIAKSYVSYMKDQYDISFKRKGKKGAAEEVENKQWNNQNFQLFFEVKSSGKQSDLNVIAKDLSGNVLAQAANSVLYSSLEKSMKLFGKSYYKEILSDELSDARKKASKGNKALGKVLKEKKYAEKKIRKTEKKINKSESKIISARKKIKGYEKDINSQSSSIESEKKDGFSLKKQVIELNGTIIEETKKVQSLEGEEKKIEEKIKTIEGL
jgi:chromosome segregation ATPase